MNAYSLTGLGVDFSLPAGSGVTMDDAAAIVTSSATMDPKKAAISGAIIGTKVLPVVGTAIGAAIAYIGSGIATLFKKAQYTWKKEDKGGLTYMSITHISSKQKGSLLIYGIPRSAICKCPLIGSCNVCRGLFENHLKIIAGDGLTRFLQNPEAFVKDPLKTSMGGLDKYVIQTVQASGKNINDVPTFIYEDANGLILAMVGGQIYSNAPEQSAQKNAQAQPSTQQAGLGWVAGLLALSVVGGLLWKASQKKK